MRRRFLRLGLLTVGLLGVFAFAIGYFEAWHLSLSRQYSATELVIDLGIHKLRHLRAVGQLDAATEQEMSAMILAQLGGLMEIRDLQGKSIAWAVLNPRAFWLVSQQVAAPRSVEELLAKARDAGVDVSALREFPGYPADMR